MKNINYIFKSVLCLIIISILYACNDFLDKEPLSQITPDKYLKEESQLAAYANRLYTDVLPSHGTFGYGTFAIDQHTDIMAYRTYHDKYIPGQLKTVQNDTVDWNFKRISSCNYFLENVLPSLEKGEVSGSSVNINHYIGEIYFMRAYEYFKRLQLFGDFPIVTNILPNEMAPLIEASKRAPRTEVARFILSDLDKAIDYMAATIDSRKTRISKNAALLLKSRVALFEGTWLKYFKGTAFVPNGEGWPGKEKDYNASYTFSSGSIDSEIVYFLTQSMEAAQQVADNVSLTENNGKLQQSITEPENEFMNMFASVNLSGFDEVLLWREYNKGLGVTHNVVTVSHVGTQGNGLTRGVVDGFLLSNGLPIYASASYMGDENIGKVRTNRDSRLSLFLKEAGQKNVLYEDPTGDHAVPIEPIPDILASSVEKVYTTGYGLRKGSNFYQNQCSNGGSYTGCIIFRAAEAYLNYMEACYEKNGTLDAKAEKYWEALRVRAHVDKNFNTTIAATDMAKEALNDWGAYSGGKLIDPTLYNIRRERKCEFMAEGLRFMDLCRWRAMDQMLTTPYHIEGIKLWGEMQHLYVNENGVTKLIYGLDDNKANVSAPSRSQYLRPYEISGKSLVLDGYKWAMAHYLTPIAIGHILISSKGGDIKTSPIYQNPYWPVNANEGAIQ